MAQVDAHFRVSQRIARDQMVDLVAFGDILLKKFQARWNVIEQLLHLHQRAERRAHLFLFPADSTFHPDSTARQRTGLPGGQRQPGDRSDGGQGFAAKAQAGDPKQVCRLE